MCGTEAGWVWRQNREEGCRTRLGATAWSRGLVSERGARAARFKTGEARTAGTGLRAGLARAQTTRRKSQGSLV